MATNDTSRMKNKIETLKQRFDNLERALARVNELIVIRRDSDSHTSMSSLNVS